MMIKIPYKKVSHLSNFIKGNKLLTKTQELNWHRAEAE